jgi:FlaA1/EpsC-like NDP-sugar epimerase
MLKQQARLLAVTVFLIDLALVSIAFGLAFVVRDAWLPQALPEQFSAGLYAFQRYLPFLPLALLVWAVALLSGGRYRSHRTANLRDEVAALFRVTAAATVSWALAIFVLRLDASLLDGDRVSRTFTVLFALFSFVLLTGEKLALRLTSRWVRQRGFNYRTLLIVGTGRAARALADSIDQHAYWGFKLLGFVRTGAAENTETDDADLPAPVLGSIHDMARIVEQNVVDDVIFAVRRRELPAWRSQFLLPPGAGHPHPLRAQPLPVDARPGAARGVRRDAAAHLLADADQHLAAPGQAQLDVALARCCWRSACRWWC